MTLQPGGGCIVSGPADAALPLISVCAGGFDKSPPAPAAQAIGAVGAAAGSNESPALNLLSQYMRGTSQNFHAQVPPKNGSWYNLQTLGPSASSSSVNNQLSNAFFILGLSRFTPIKTNS